MLHRAIILAGGEGTRLRPVTLEMPKPLVTVRQTPIATWLVRLFLRHGVSDITVIVPPKWLSHFENWRASLADANIQIWVEPEPMGTMGALVHELSIGNDPVFVTNGDELKHVDLNKLERFHLEERTRDSNYAATIALLRVPNPSEYGVAEMDGTRIARFHEKPAIPPSTWINSGLYVVEPSTFLHVDRSRRHLMFEKDLFPKLAEEGRLGGCPLDGAWYDCGTMERWERAIREWPGF